MAKQLLMLMEGLNDGHLGSMLLGWRGQGYLLGTSTGSVGTLIAKRGYGVTGLRGI